MGVDAKSFTGSFVELRDGRRRKAAARKISLPRLTRLEICQLLDQLFGKEIGIVRSHRKPVSERRLRNLSRHRCRMNPSELVAIPTRSATSLYGLGGSSKKSISTKCRHRSGIPVIASRRL